MSSKLSALRKQVRAYSGLDGSWDLTLGLIIMAGTLLIKIGQGRLAGLAIIGISLAINCFRTRVSRPRLGYFRLTRAQKRAEVFLSIGATLIFLMIYIIALFVADKYFPDLVFLILGVLSAAAILVLGNYYGLRRFYFYALLLLGGFTVMHFYRTWLVEGLFLCGLVITLAGIIVLHRFIRAYPAYNGEDDHD